MPSFDTRGVYVTAKTTMENVKQRFLCKVKIILDRTSCWEWKSSVLTGRQNGYGRIKFEGVYRRAHRIAIPLFKCIELGPNDVVCHTCDNRLCVRPGHLVVADVQWNNADRHRKQRTASGERNGFAKLSNDDIPVIRRLHEAGVSKKELGARYGVHRTTISEIVNKVRWKSIKGV